MTVLKQGTPIGPIQNKMQYEKVKSFLEGRAEQRQGHRAGGQASGARGLFHRARPSCATSATTPVWSERNSSARCCRCCPTQHRRRHRPHQRHRYGLGGSVWSAKSNAASPWPPRSIRARSGSTGWTCLSTFRSAAPSSQASEPNWATLASRRYQPGLSTWPSSRPDARSGRSGGGASRARRCRGIVKDLVCQAVCRPSVLGGSDPKEGAFIPARGEKP